MWLTPRLVATSAGRVVLDEDLERIAFVASLGTIPPLESISIFISTSSELQTLPSGAVRVLLPAVCVPRVPQHSSESSSTLPAHQLRTYEATGRDRGAGGGLGTTPQSTRAADAQSLGTQHMWPALTGARLTRRAKPCCRSGSPEQGSSSCLAQLLESEATNPSEYEFSFHLEIRGPCLLAGRACCGVLITSGQRLPSSSSSWRGVLPNLPAVPPGRRREPHAQNPRGRRPLGSLGEEHRHHAGRQAHLRQARGDPDPPQRYVGSAFPPPPQPLPRALSRGAGIGVRGSP